MRVRTVLANALAAFFVQACGEMTTQDTPSAPPQDDPPSSAASTDPDCEPTALPPALTRYDAITDGVVFSLALVQDERGVWGPVEQLGMPFHHASSIEWQRRELLDAHAGARVVVIATGLGRTTIEHDPDRNTWFATYAARVERVCRAEESVRTTP